LAQELDWRRVLLLGGRPRIAEKLAEVGLDLMSTKDDVAGMGSGEPFDAIVAISQLGRAKPDRAGETIRSWVAALRPGGTLAMAELAAEGGTGSLAMKLAHILRGKAFMDPAEQCGLLLQAGIRNVRQVWPQGVGSWVLSHGVKAVLAQMRQAPNER